MISILPCTDRDQIDALFAENGLSVNEFSGGVIARFGDEILGCCLYDLTDKGILIRLLVPTDDLMLADGILRSALHIAAERSAMDARYADTAPEQLFERLQFISDKAQKKLDIDKLFRGCNCKKTEKL